MTTTAVQKLPTGIPGLDLIADGGFPEGRIVLVAGTAGSAKTVLAGQFLMEGVRSYNQPGVFVTFEETPTELRHNFASFGWGIDEMEENDQWRFLDASVDATGDSVVVGPWDFEALRSRLAHAVSSIGARRVVLDSLDAVFSDYPDAGLVRREMRRVSAAIRELGVTAVATVERTAEYGPISRYGVEEFVSSNVLVLRTILEDEAVRRTMQVLKFRGTTHRKGEFPFTVVPANGIVVLPLTDEELKQRSTDVRVTSGNAELDKMTNGGFFRDSVTLISGATGTGKTLTVTEFMGGAAANKERSLLFAFEESRDQLFRNASGWGVDFETMERNGQLVVVSRYPESAGLEDHLVSIREALDRYQPQRFALDSLSALERISPWRGFRHFVIALTAMLKERQITGVFTSTTPSLTGGDSVTVSHISTLTDAIILLRYVEVYGEIKRGLAVLKMRGSTHDRNIHELTISGTGMNIGPAYRAVGGILSGSPVQLPKAEVDRLGSLFVDE